MRIEMKSSKMKNGPKMKNDIGPKMAKMAIFDTFEKT